MHYYLTPDFDLFVASIWSGHASTSLGHDRRCRRCAICFQPAWIGIAGSRKTLFIISLASQAENMDINTLGPKLEISLLIWTERTLIILVTYVIRRSAQIRQDCNPKCMKPTTSMSAIAGMFKTRLSSMSFEHFGSLMHPSISLFVASSPS